MANIVYIVDELQPLLGYPPLSVEPWQVISVWLVASILFSFEEYSIGANSELVLLM